MSDESNHLSCRLNSACDCVHVLGSMVEVMGHRAGLSDKETNRMVLAVDELFANIAQHGYGGREGRVDMKASLEGHALSFEFRDYAPALGERDMLAWSTAEAGLEQADKPLRPGGLGMHLMRAVMDCVEHEALPDGNLWVLTKYLKNKEPNGARP